MGTGWKTHCPTSSLKSDEALDRLAAASSDRPRASVQVIKDLKGSDYSWSYQTPPSSPSSSSSRKSSMCRWVLVSGSRRGSQEGLGRPSKAV